MYYNESCQTTSECKANLNLACTNKTCICSNPLTQYWNGTYCGLYLNSYF